MPRLRCPRGRFTQLADYRDPAKLATWFDHISHNWQPHRRHYAHGPGASHPYRDGSSTCARSSARPTPGAAACPSVRCGPLPLRPLRRAIDAAELEKGRVSLGVYLSTVGPFRSYCASVPRVKKMLKALTARRKPDAA
jgi:hypothetical protein